LVAVLANLTGFNGANTLPLTGPIVFLLLLQAVGSLYAGYCAADGEGADAWRKGALAGAVCGLATAGAWSVFDVFGSFDPNYIVQASIARVVALTIVGGVAGGEGAHLWQTSGVGPKKRQKPPKPAATWSRRGFHIGPGVIWGGVGFLLLALFFAGTSSLQASDTFGRLLQWGGSVIAIWAAAIAIGLALVGLFIGLRAAWPALAPVRHAIWTGILYAFAIGGAGNRARANGARRLLLALGLLFLLFWPYIDPYILQSGTGQRVSILADTGFYVILALGLNVVVGFAGLLDLGYVAFFAFGAFTWSMLGSNQFAAISFLVHRLDNLPIVPQHLPFGIQPWAWLFWPGLLIGALVAAGFGVLLGVPTLRLRGDYLAIVTLGFGEIVPIAFRNVPGITAGSNAIPGVPSPVIPGVKFPILLDITPFYFLILVLIVLAVISNIRLRDSRLGRAWVALREDEIATAASGINTVRIKLLAFATGAFFSGLAGVYHASKLGAIGPADFSFSDSIVYLAMVVLGGLGSIPGVMLGAVVIGLLNGYFLPLVNSQRTDPNSIFYIFHNFDVSYVRFIIFGGMLVGMMLLRPEGLIPNRRRSAELHGEVATETEQPVLDALDAAVGGPAFAEDRVV
jgi:ABC-type branched-subunit amino acid transport system permease subunit